MSPEQEKLLGESVDRMFRLHAMLLDILVKKEILTSGEAREVILQAAAPLRDMPHGPDGAFAKLLGLFPD